MKNICLALFCLVCFQTAEAQTDTIPVYLRFPVLPVFTIMTAPDSLKFTKDDIKKKKYTVIMIFSPDCEHCHVATKDLLGHIDLFKKAQVIMAASADFKHIKDFYAQFKIADYPNITVGRDGTFLLGSFYKVHQYPSVYVYDKKGHFIKAFEGTFKMEDVAGAL